MDGRKNSSSLSAVLAIGLSCLIFQANPARAADDDLPAPMGNHDADVPTAEPAPQADLPDFGGDASAAPPLSGEGENLPEPGANAGAEKNVVNRSTEQDDIFLPTPAVQDNVNYAPLGTPVNSRIASNEDNDWRYGMANRPSFSLGLGGIVRNYPTLPDKKYGLSIAGSWRALNIAQTLFLHAYASGSLIGLGDVGPYPNAQDITIQYGGMLELGIGRRLSLYGSLLRRTNTIRAGAGPNKDPRYLDGIDEPDSWQLGFGGQYDFYVVPHGSLGVRVHFERDVALFLLNMAIEPAPRKKLSLSFDPVDR